MAASITALTFTKTGTKATTPTKLDASVFGRLPEHHELLKTAYVAYLANGRVNLAVTKTRGLVSGGGKKPWRQKGTGRARFGSSRNPIWRGGGIAFGPTGQENYTKKLSLTAKRQALIQALSLAADEGRIKVIEEFVNKDSKVAVTATFLRKINAQGSILLVLDVKDKLAIRATNNLPDVKLVQSTYLNIFDLLNSDSIIMSRKAVDNVTAWLGSKA
jgi:large subunit ribosomal protein L4